MHVRTPEKCWHSMISPRQGPRQTNVVWRKVNGKTARWFDPSLMEPLPEFDLVVVSIAIGQNAGRGLTLAFFTPGNSQTTGMERKCPPKDGGY